MRSLFDFKFALLYSIGKLALLKSTITLVNVYAICWYLRVLLVLHILEVVDIGVHTI